MARATWKEIKAELKETGLAYLRQGAKELGAALYGPGTVAQSPEYGMPTTKLPSEIAADMKGEAEKKDIARDNSATLERYTQEPPDKVREPDREPEPEMDRD